MSDPGKWINYEIEIAGYFACEATDAMGRGVTEADAKASARALNPDLDEARLEVYAVMPDAYRQFDAYVEADRVGHGEQWHFIEIKGRDLIIASESEHDGYRSWMAERSKVVYSPAVHEAYARNYASEAEAPAAA